MITILIISVSLSVGFAAGMVVAHRLLKNES